MKTMRRKGFTLIEMLIVIAIIGLLASILLIGFGSIRASGRNATRTANLRVVQQQLEVYYTKNGTYPAQAGSGAASWTGLQTSLTDPTKGDPSISKLPNDPNTGASYAYYTQDQLHYVLWAQLESAANRDSLHNAGFTGVQEGASCTDASYYCIFF